MVITDATQCILTSSPQGHRCEGKFHHALGSGLGDGSGHATG
jgi:hypothetical protein